jgi:hypothetical protein
MENELSIGFNTHKIDYHLKPKTYHVKLKDLNMPEWIPTIETPPVVKISLTTRSQMIIVFIFDHPRYFKPLHKLTGWMFVSINKESYRLFIDNE